MNSGAELFTVSVKDTATNFRATRPRTTVENLGKTAVKIYVSLIKSCECEIIVIGFCK